MGAKTLTPFERREAARERLSQLERYRTSPSRPLDLYRRDNETKKEKSVFERSLLTGGDLLGNVFSGFSKGIEGIADLGMGVYGAVAGIFDKEHQEAVKKAISYDWTGENITRHLQTATEGSYLKDGGIIEGIASGVGQMLPAVLISLGTAGIGTAVGASAGAVAKAGQIASLATMGASAAGSGTEEAFNEGAEYGRGLLYGGVTGAKEVATEKLFGGLSKGLTGKGVLNFGDDIAEQGAKRIIKGAVEEGLEEVASEGLDPMAKSIYKGSEAFKEYTDPEYYKGVGRAFVEGAGVGMVYGGTIGKAYNKFKGINEDIGAAVEANSEIDKKLTDAQDSGQLTENAEAEAKEAKQKNLENIEKTLKNVSEKTRERYIKNYGLENLFESDGSLKNVTKSASENLDKRYYSVSSRGKEGSILEDLRLMSEENGEEIKPFSGELTEKESANFIKMKKSLTALNKRRGSDVSFVLVEENSSFNGATRRANTIYISKDTLGKDAAMTRLDEASKSGNYAGTLFHEYGHTLSEKGQKKLISFLEEDKELAQAARERVLSDYGFTKEEIAELKNKAPKEMTAEERELMHAFEREYSSTLEEYYLGDEWAVNKLVNEDAPLAEKIIGKLGGMLKNLSGKTDAGSREDRKRLRKALELYEKAVSKSDKLDNKEIRKLFAALRDDEEEEIRTTDGSYDVENNENEALTNTNGQNVEVRDGSDNKKAASDNGEAEVSYSKKNDSTQQSKKFSEYAIATALYDALDHMDSGDDNLIKISRMPRFVSELFGIEGDLYIYRDHAYENTVSRERAIEEGRPIKRGKADIHFHDLGEERMITALNSIDDPIMVVQAKHKDGNPAVIMMLTEKGNDGAPLYAVLSFYANQPINGKFDTKPHIVATISPREWTVPEGGRQGWAELIAEAVDEGKVLYFDKKRGNDLSVIAQRTRLGNITVASLNNSIARFKRFVNEYKQKNKISYSRKSSSDTDGNIHKRIAEWEKLKVYEKADAEKMINNIITSILPLDENDTAILDGASRKKAETLLWDKLNSAQGEDQMRKAAEEVAEYIIARSIVKTWITDYQDKDTIDRAENAKSYLKGFLKNLNLSRIKDEIRHKYDTDAKGVMLMWGSKKSGFGVDEIVSEANSQVKGYGFPIDASASPADQFFVIHEAYTKASRDLKTLYEKYRDRALDEAERKRLKADITERLVEGYRRSGRESMYAKAKASFKAELMKAELNVDYMKAYNRLFAAADAFKDITMGRFLNANTYHTDIFEGSINQLKKIVRGGIVSVKQTREAIAKLALWYTEENPIVGKNYESDIKEKLSILADKIILNKDGERIDIKTLLGQFRANLDLSSIRSELKEIYGTKSGSVVRAWNRKGDDEGIKISDAAETLRLNGIQIGGSDLEMFLQIDQMYNDTEGPFSIDDLNRLTDVVKYFSKFIKEFNKIYVKGQYVDALPKAKEFVTRMQENRTINLGMFEKIMNSRYAKYFSRPITLARFMDKYRDGFYTEAVKSFRQGSVEAANYEYEMMRPVAEFAESHKKYFDGLGKRKITYLNTEMSADIALSLYLTSKREQAQAGLAVSGFKFEAGKETVRLPGYMPHEVPGGVGRGAEQMQKKLYESFTEEDKQFIRIVEEIFNKDCKDLKYDTDMKTKGYSNTQDGYYYPIKRAFVAKSIDSDFEDLMGRASNKSFNKDTVKGAKGELCIMPLTEVFSRHVKGIAQYAALATVVRNYDTLYNLDTGGNANSPTSIASESEQTWKDGADYLKKLLTDVQGLGDRGSAFLAAIRGNYAKFQLGANPKTWVTQLSSFFAATSELDYDCIIKGFGIESSDVDEYCVAAKLRDANNDAILAQANTRKPGLLEKRSKIGERIEAVSDVLMTPIGKVDRFVITRLFGACQAQIEKNGGAKVGTDENKKAAGELLAEVIFSTQQNSFATEKSAAMRSTSDIVKGFTMFSADGMNVIGQVIDALGEVTALKAITKKTGINLDKELKATKRKARRAIASLVVSSLFMTALAMLFNWLYHRYDEEDEPVDIAVDALGNFGGNLIGGLPIFRDVYSYIADGYEVNNYLFSTINDTLGAVKGSIDLVESVVIGTADKRAVAKNIRDLIYSTGQLTGLPMRNVYNVAYSVIGWDSGIKYSIDDLFYAQSYTADLARAIDKGDERTIANISGIIMKESVGDIENKGILNELNRLSVAGHSVLPRTVGDKITVGNEEYTLNTKEKKAFKEIYSQANDGLSAMISLKQYSKASDEAKARAVDRVYDMYYELAKADRAGETEKSKDALFLEALDAQWIAIAVGVADTLEADKDKNGKVISGSRKKKVIDFIESLNISAAQKYMILGYLGYKNLKGEQKVKAYISTLKLTREEKKRLLEYSGYEV